MKRFLTFLTPILVLFYSGALQARTWDPRLSQVSDLAYQGNIQQAAKVADQYLQENPQDPNAYYFRAMVFDWERNLTDKDPEILKDKSLKFYKKGSNLAFHLWNKDRENVDKLIDIGNGYIFYGRILSDKGSWFRAIMTAKKGPKHLEKAIQLDPKRTDGLMTLGTFHYVADNTPKAAAPFKKLFGIRGSREMGLQELKKSITGNHPFHNDGIVALYYVNMEFDKNYPEALHYLELLESKFPDNPKFVMLKAEVWEKQDKQKGLEGYLGLVEWCNQKPGVCPKKFRYEAFYHAGRLAMDLQQNSTALSYFQKSIQAGLARNPALHAHALLWSGNLSPSPEKSLDFYRRAKDLPGSPKPVRKDAKKAQKALCSVETPPKNC